MKIREGNAGIFVIILLTLSIIIVVAHITSNDQSIKSITGFQVAGDCFTAGERDLEGVFDFVSSLREDNPFSPAKTLNRLPESKKEAYTDILVKYYKEQDPTILESELRDRLDLMSPDELYSRANQIEGLEGEIGELSKIYPSEISAGEFSNSIRQLATEEKLNTELLQKITGDPKYFLGGGREGFVFHLEPETAVEYGVVSEDDLAIKIFRRREGNEEIVTRVADVMNDLAEDGLSARIYKYSDKYYITDEITGPTAAQFIKSAENNLELETRRELVKAGLEDFADQLAERGIIVKDLHLDNVKWVNDKIVIIDVGEEAQRNPMIRDALTGQNRLMTKEEIKEALLNLNDPEIRAVLLGG